MTEHVLNYWEDDPDAIRIMPARNLAYCLREFGRIRQHSAEHYIEGVGWSDIYRLSDDEASTADTIALADLGIAEEAFVALLESSGRRFDRLNSSLGEFEAEMGIRSIGFGYDARSGVIADISDHVVVGIWCLIPADKPDAIEMQRNMLIALGQAYPLLLVDWNALQLVDMASRDAIEDYLSGC